MVAPTLLVDDCGCPWSPEGFSADVACGCGLICGGVEATTCAQLLLGVSGDCDPGGPPKEAPRNCLAAAEAMRDEGGKGMEGCRY